jgi:hypothetical protein
MESGQAEFKIGLQGTTIRGEGVGVKLYVSKLFE